MRWLAVLLALATTLGSSDGETGHRASKQLPCTAPTSDYLAIARSQTSAVFVRPTTEGHYQMMRGCVRGHRTIQLGYPTDTTLVRTKGVWAVYPESGGGYYDIEIVDLRPNHSHRFRRYPLRGYQERNPITWPSLNARGVFAYVQVIKRHDVLFLRGRTRSRRLATGPYLSITAVRVRGHKVSWRQNAHPRSATFEIERGRIRP